MINLKGFNFMGQEFQFLLMIEGPPNDPRVFWSFI
jgi:hypothetical protein